MSGNQPSSRDGKPETSETKENDSILSILKEFCEYTSWGGLGRVVGSRLLFFRILWFLVFLAALGAGISQLVGLFFLYQSKPVSTKISLEHSVTQPFPSVTICNHNIIRKSRLKDLPDSIKTSIAKYATKRNASFGGSSGHNKKSLYEDHLGVPDPSSLHGNFKIAEEVAALLAKQDESKLKPLGHQFYDMIRTCSYEGMDCRNVSAEMSWRSFWHYKFGNCYIFNPKTIARKEGLIASKPGPSYGLVVEMDIQQDEYLDQLTPDAGAVIDITPRGHMPFPFEQGKDLAPGFTTSIGMRVVKIKRVKKGNSCVNTERKSSENQDIYAEKYNTSYSKTACSESCMGYNQRKYCGCMEYKYQPRHHVCDVFNMTTVLCLRKVFLKARKDELNCTSGCPPPCNEKTYSISSSFSSWPSENYMETLAVETKNVNITNYLRKNVLKVEIFFQVFEYEYIHERISYVLSNFISDIGGQLGLWLGVSVLSGLEIIELIVVLIHHLCGQKYRLKNRSIEQGKGMKSNELSSFSMS